MEFYRDASNGAMGQRFVSAGVTQKVILSRVRTRCEKLFLSGFFSCYHLCDGDSKLSFHCLFVHASLR